MDVFEIVLQHSNRGIYPVVAEYSRSGDFLATRRVEGILRFDETALQQLDRQQFDPLAYGTTLGKALFQEDVRDGLAQARRQSDSSLRILLVVEDPTLKTLHWERLCGPISRGGRWDFLALDQEMLFSLYLPSLTDRRFPAIGRRDLNALVVIADPGADNRYGLAEFDAAATMHSVKSALGEIPHVVLANAPGADGPPTLNAIADQLTNNYYTILHVVAHGLYQQASGESVIYLLDESGAVDPAMGEWILTRLDRIRGRGLPHFVFLSTCESAMPAAEGALGGLGQRLVRELGLPAVVAMTQKISIATAEKLAARFYVQLREHGEPDRALVEAGTALASAGDVMVPALFSRLGGRPLFSDTLDRELTNKEIDFGLTQLADWFQERAPILIDELGALSESLTAINNVQPEALTEERLGERDDALAAVNSLCEEVLNINFRAVALGQAPPAYDSRCPFPGLRAFQPEDKQFFYGREALTQKLSSQLIETDFLALLGPSGSGKSSVVFAGLVPALQDHYRELQVARMTPGQAPTLKLQQLLSQLRLGRHALLILDQFEELFTLVASEAERRRFIDLLLTLPGKLAIVITMRADFWGECARYPQLKELMQKHQELIGPMTTSELRSAMEQQAATVGLRFEADLSHTILESVQDEPGAMPLLQHALLEMWGRRHGRWLLTREYRAIGGVQKAIASTAEKIFAGVSAEAQGQIRDIFVRLTRLGDSRGGEEHRDTRRRVMFSEVVPAGTDPAQIRRLVNDLADARLVVTGVDQASGEETLEVAHEALIQHWPRLKHWLDEDREILRLRDGVRQAASEWSDAAPEDKESLLSHRGSRLEEIETLVRLGRLRLNENEFGYIRACIQLREAARQREEAQRQRELAQARALAAEQKRLAEEQRKRAEEQAQLAEAQQQRAEDQARLAQAQQERAEEQEKAATKLRRRAYILAGVVGLAVILAVAAGVAASIAASASREATDNFNLASTREIEAVAQQQTAQHNFNLAATQEQAAIQNAAEAAQNAAAAATSEAAAQAAATEAISQRATAVFNEEVAEANAREADAQFRQADAGRLASISNDPLERADSRLWFAANSAVMTLAADGLVTFAAFKAMLARLHSPYRQVFVLGHTEAISSVAFSPDGTLIATAGRDGVVALWERDGTLRQTLIWHQGPVNDIAFGPAGARLASASDDGSYVIWDVASGMPTDFPLNIGVESVAFDPSGDQIFVGDIDGLVRLFSAFDGTELGFYDGHDGPVVDIDVFADGARFISSSLDGTARLWQTDGTIVRTFAGHQGEIFAAAIAPDENLVATASGDNTTRLWRVSGELLATFANHNDPVNDVAFSPDGSRLTTVGDDKLIIVQNLEGQVLFTLEGHASFVSSVAYSPEGTQLLTGSIDLTAMLWDADGGQIAEITGHEAEVIRLAISPDGSQILTSSLDETVRLWDTTGNQLAEFVGHDGIVSSVAFSPDGQQVLTAGHDGTARLWDLAGNELTLITAFAGQDALNVARYTSDGGQIVASTDEGDIFVWDLDGNVINSFAASEVSITALALSPDGNTLLIGDIDGNGALWDLSGQLLQTLELHTDEISSAEFSADGQFFLLGGFDKQISYWSSAGENLAARDMGDNITWATFSPDGKYIAVSSLDDTVRLVYVGGTEQFEFLNTIIGDVVLTISPTRGDVNAVIFSPDGQQLMTAQEADIVMIWPLQTDSLAMLALAVERLGPQWCGSVDLLLARSCGLP